MRAESVRLAKQADASSFEAEVEERSSIRSAKMSLCFCRWVKASTYAVLCPEIKSFGGERLLPSLGDKGVFLFDAGGAFCMKKKKDCAQGALQLKSLWEPAGLPAALPFRAGRILWYILFINVFLISFQNDYNMMTGALFRAWGGELPKILADPLILTA